MTQHLLNGDVIDRQHPMDITISSDVIPVTDTTFSGQVTVTTAGTPVQGPSKVGARGFLITPLSTNTGVSWVFPWGSTKVLKGFPIAIGSSIVLNVTNLNQIGFDVDTSGNTVCWLEL
jgi:hypothetical protein